MRLLQREPETPSLETWLSRDVPHEREMAGAMLEKMGRENALAALLVIHDREEAKRQKQRWLVWNLQLGIVGVSGLVLLAGIPTLHLIHIALATLISVSLNMISACVSIAATVFGFGQSFKASQRQQNVITALFNYADNPLIADPLCRAINYYDDKNQDRWALFANIMRVLPLLPDAKDALTKDARRSLRNRLLVIEDRPPRDLTGENQADRARYADFEIAVLRYFSRTRDKQALPAIRKIAKAKSFSSDGARIKDVARVALQAFGEPTP